MLAEEAMDIITDSNIGRETRINRLAKEIGDMSMNEFSILSSALAIVAKKMNLVTN